MEHETIHDQSWRIWQDTAMESIALHWHNSRVPTTGLHMGARSANLRSVGIFPSPPVAYRAYMGMDQYLLIPFLVGWTYIYQLFWCSPGVQGFDTLPYHSPLFLCDLKKVGLDCWQLIILAPLTQTFPARLFRSVVKCHAERRKMAQVNCFLQMIPSIWHLAFVLAFYMAFYPLFHVFYLTYILSFHLFLSDIYIYIYIYSDILYSDIWSDIHSDILSNIFSTYLTYLTYLTYILKNYLIFCLTFYLTYNDIYLEIRSDIFSGFLSNKYSDIFSGIVLGKYSDILSNIRSDIYTGNLTNVFWFYLTFYLAFYLTFYQAFYLTFYLTFYVAYILHFMRHSNLHSIWHISCILSGIHSDILIDVLSDSLSDILSAILSEILPGRYSIPTNFQTFHVLGGRRTSIKSMDIGPRSTFLPPRLALCHQHETARSLL